MEGNPGASEQLAQVLLRDQFVDAMDSVHVPVYIQQVHVQELQEALARGLELESILRSNPREVRATSVLCLLLELREGVPDELLPHYPAIHHGAGRGKF